MPVNIAAFDLKLLIVFDAVMHERNVSRAAERIGISQPAVSNALNRLREQLQDQLFIRTADGVRPTERAIEMAVDVADGLRSLQVALEPRSAAMTSPNWKFVIAMSEQTMVVVLPRLLNVIAASKKSISIHTKPKTNATIQKEIDAMEVDLAVGTIPNLAMRFDRHVLYCDKYVIMMAKNNPLYKNGVSPKDFSTLEQIAVRGNHDLSTRIDRELLARGVRRNVVMNVNQYHILPKVLRTTSLISLIPRSIVHEFDRNEFSFQEAPFDIPEVDVLAVTHRSRRENTAIRWLQNALMEACADLTPLVSQQIMDNAA